MRRTLVAGIVLALLSSLAPVAAANDYQIVSGQPAAEGAYPWMAAVLFDGSQGCGGSVVADQWVLTAAHCVTDERGQRSVSPDEVVLVVDANNWIEEGVDLQAAEIVIHPGYDPISTNNDMTLIRTAEPIPVAPVRLAGPAEAFLNDPPTQATVIGYGATSTGGDASEVLLEVDVPVVSDADCAASYGQLSPTTMVCAGAPTDDPNNPGRDSCQGDSGGPLFATVDGEHVQFGVVSFGNDCGVADPGVYAQVTAYTDWIAGVIGGDIGAGDPDPGPAGDLPEGAATDPIRVQSGDGNDPVAQAIAMSQLVFRQDASFGVLATSANFPDALGGSALASYHGPLLYVDAAGQLPDATLREFQRVVPTGGTIYILGGEAVIGADVAATLAGAGFVVQRLGGAGRQQTAALVAEEVLATVNQGLGSPFDSVIVAFEGNWPDAVAVGQISAFFGIPILLTPRDQLGAPAVEYLQTHQPTLVMTLGGDAVISDAVLDQIEGITGPGTVLPLEGASRIGTSVAITRFHTEELLPLAEEIFDFEGDPLTEPQVIVAVNLRRDDAFAHVLAASTIVGNFGGVFAPLEGADGTIVEQDVLDSVCGLDVGVIAAGGPALVPDAAVAALQQASGGQGCAFG